MISSPTDSESSNSEKCCAVCGHSQARNNFGTLSCNACAAFFRRTLIQGRKYACQCSSSDDEDPTMMERAATRDCKYCRFQKCLRAGMQEKSIRSIEVWKWRAEMMRSKGAGAKDRTTMAIIGKHHQKRRPKAAVCKIEWDEKTTTTTPFYAPFPPDDVQEMHLLANFLHAEGKLDRIHHSCSELPDNLIDRYRHADDMLGVAENLLGNAGQFRNELPPCYSKEMLSQIEHIWSIRPEQYIRDLLISIGFAKSLPIFNQLDTNDQRILVRSQTLPGLDLFVTFYSFQRGHTTLLSPNCLPIIELFKAKKYQHDPIVLNLAQKVYTHSLNRIRGVAPTREEFAYLLALIFTNAAVTGLSKHGQQLLRTESEKYGRALLRLQQRELGDAKGALRYADTLRLIGQSILNAHRHTELIVYLDSMHDQGRFEEVMPKAFVPYCTIGPCELAQLIGPT